MPRKDLLLSHIDCIVNVHFVWNEMQDRNLRLRYATEHT